MSEVIPCPACNSPLRIRAEYAGQQIKCPKCENVIRIPDDPAAQAGGAAPVAEEPTAINPVQPAAPAGEEAIAEVLPVKRQPPPLPAEGRYAEGAAPARPQRGGRTCPACGERNSPEARRCRACREPLDERDDDDGGPPRRPRISYAPCPKCGARGARRVTWTFWGSFYGPALFTHVRCPNCRYAYNGRTGRSNLIPAIIFITIPAVLILAIFAGLGWLIISTGRMR